MFIPLRTDRYTRRRPIVIETIIILNVLVYLAGLVAEFTGTLENRGDLSLLGWLDPHHFQLWQLVTYQFLHDPYDYAHIIFNMLFLWVFGGPVEDRLGRIGFLTFYIIGGVVAGLAHMWTSANPVIGASGSVAAVSGAFLALFPRSKIRVFVFFFMIGVYEIPALWFIGLYIIINIVQATSNALGSASSNVAYVAHLGGYIYGFVVAFTLLGVGLLKRTEFDAFYLFKQARRRTEFRRTQSQASGALWDVSASNTRAEKPKQVHADRKLTAEQEERARRRTEIQSLVQQHDLANAALKYGKLLDTFPDAVLNQQTQLDVANTLYADGDYPHAAQAYTLLLEHYPMMPSAHEVRLILGMLYARQLKDPVRARELIQSARPRLDKQHAELADTLLAELPPVFQPKNKDVKSIGDLRKK